MDNKNYKKRDNKRSLKKIRKWGKNQKLNFREQDGLNVKTEHLEK